MERPEGQLENTSEVEVEEEGEARPGQERKEKPTSETDGQGSREDQPKPGSEDKTPQYQHQLLKGKTPEEIDRLFEVTLAANRSMNTQLNERAGGEPAAPAPRKEEEEKDPYGDTFLSPHLEKLEQRLRRHLDETVAPLREATRHSEGESTRERMRSQYKHFVSLETVIDDLLRQQKQNPLTASESQLKLLYHTAVGLAAENGINLDSKTKEAPAPAGQPSGEASQEQSPVNLPQHRPSGAPLPKGQQQQKRQLTEEERRLAREFYPESKTPEDDYRKDQDADESEVVQPGFSKKNW